MKRILAIDGGGVKGTFPAAFLAAIEESIDDRIPNYFDLIVGTSTGGIIALGLGLGWTAAELLSFYEDYGPKIFQKASLWKRLMWAVTAKYDPTPLHEALEDQFGGRRIGESTVRLVIPSANLETGGVYLYKTSHRPWLRVDYKKEAIEAARATSAAPTYFPSYISKAGVPLVDGGLWANNPLAVAAVEAVGVLEWERDEVVVLSLGCTRSPFDARHAQRWALGRGYWAFKARELFMATQSSSAKGMAKCLLRKENVMRYNPTVPPGRFKLDGAKGIRALKGLGRSEARRALPELRKQVFTHPAEPFIPHHQLEE